MNGARQIPPWKAKERMARKSSFAPFQLAAQDLEIRLVWRLNELQLFVAPPDARDIRGLHGQAALSVDREINGFRVADSHFDGGGIGNNQGAVAQHVRTDGGDNERSHGGMQDGATGGEGVGGGASRARNDQSIRTVTANKIGIDAQLQLNHSCERDLMNNGFINAELCLDDRASDKQLLRLPQPL